MHFNCPLCESRETEFFHQEINGHKRQYFKCNNCDLVFANPNNLLLNNEEKSRYENHNNSNASDGYLNFLRTLIDPMKKYILEGHQGLDFGSGPYPMLVNTLKSEGFQIEGFDPYFANFKKLLESQYDYIFCCEVSEHFNSPKESFKLLSNLLKKGGFLGVKTSLLNSSIDFSNWYYKKDDTHISFYSEISMAYIAKVNSLKLLSLSDTVIIFQKI